MTQPIIDGQRLSLILLAKEVGCDTDEMRYWWASRLLHRDITSFNELTIDDWRSIRDRAKPRWKDNDWATSELFTQASWTILNDYRERVLGQMRLIPGKEEETCADSATGGDATDAASASSPPETTAETSSTTTTSIHNRRKPMTETKQTTFTEAPAVIWTTIIHPTTRLQLSVTARADTLAQAHSDIAKYALAKLEQGWIAAPGRDGQEALRNGKASNRREVAQEAAANGREEHPPVAPSRTGPAPAPTKSGNGDGAVKSGTAPLTKVAVDADGRVEFYLAGFKWPLKDARGAEVVTGLFDDSLGWEPEDLQPGRKHEGADVAGLVVDWQKPGRYYNVMQVHKA